MAAWLTHLETGKRWRLTSHLDNVIGRHVQARVRLALDGLSRKHTRIRLSARGWESTDLGSTGGTFIRPASGAVSRANSHVLKSGDTLVYAGGQLQFLDDGQPPDGLDSPAAMVRELLQVVESGGETDQALFLTSEVVQLRAEWGALLDKLVTAPDLENERGRGLAATVIGELCVNLATVERPALVETLERLASDGVPSVRVHALHELGRLPESIGSLGRALFDPDHAVFEAALAGLRRWKVSAVEPLEKLLRTVSAERSPRVAAELEAERRAKR